MADTELSNSVPLPNLRQSPQLSRDYAQSFDMLRVGPDDALVEPGTL